MNYFCQKILYQYMTDYDIDQHIETIRKAYGRQRDAMVEAIEKFFPQNISYAKLEGGMFLWVTLPKGVSSMRLFEKCIEKKVAFVPGNPFYVNRTDVNTLRLNFSCVDEETIVEGVKRISDSIIEIFRL